MDTEESSGRASCDARPSIAVVEQGVYVTLHARQRLQLHHPNAGIRGALALLARAEEVESGLMPTPLTAAFSHPSVASGGVACPHAAPVRVPFSPPPRKLP